MRTECPWCPISQRMSCSRDGFGTTVVPCPTESWNWEMGARDCTKSAVLHGVVIYTQTICTTWILVAQVSIGVAEGYFLGNRKPFAPVRGMAGRPAVEALWESSHESLWWWFPAVPSSHGACCWMRRKRYRAVYSHALRFLGLGWMAKLTMPMLGKLWTCISSQPGFWHVCMFCVFCIPA